MTTTPKNIIPSVQITNATKTYYTVPTGSRCILKKLTLENPTGTARTVTLYLVPFGGTAGDSNTIMKTFSVGAAPARATDVTEVINHVLEQGDFIQAVASASTAVTLRASGIEVSA